MLKMILNFTNNLPLLRFISSRLYIERPFLRFSVQRGRSLYDFRRGGGGKKEDGTAQGGGSRGWKYGERLSEEDRAKGIILIAPDFLSSPLCDPRVRFLIHPLSLGHPPRRPPPRTDGSKSFLRLIFPSNLHAAVIKGLGAQYIIRRFADATVKGVGFHRSPGRPAFFETMAAVLSGEIGFRDSKTLMLPRWINAGP